MKKILLILVVIYLTINGCSSNDSERPEVKDIFNDVSLITDASFKDSNGEIEDEIFIDDNGGVDSGGDIVIDNEEEEDAYTYDVINDTSEEDVIDDLTDNGGGNEKVKIMTLGNEMNEEGTGIFIEGDNIYITGFVYDKDYSSSDILIGVLNEKTNTSTLNYMEYDMSFGIELQDGIIYVGGYTGSSGSFSGFFGLFNSYLEPIEQHTYKEQKRDLQFFAFKKYDPYNYILAGFVSNSDNDAAVYIVGSDGRIKKSQVFEKNLDQEFYAIDIDFEGNIILAGIDVVDTTNWMDIYVVKLTKDLDIIWEKRIGTQEMDGAYDVKVLPNGDILVSGYTEKNSSLTGRDGYAILLDKDGNILKEMIFEQGGDGEIKSAVFDGRGHILFVMIENIYDPFSSIGDLTLIKTDMNGNILDGEILSSDANASRIVPFGAGYLIIGTFYDPPEGQGDSDVLLINVKEF